MFPSLFGRWYARLGVVTQILNQGMNQPRFVFGFPEEGVFEQFGSSGTFGRIFLETVFDYMSERFSIGFILKMSFTNLLEF